MKLKLAKELKIEFQELRDDFMGEFEFFDDLNVAVALGSENSYSEFVQVAVFATITPMTKKFGFWEVVNRFNECDTFQLRRNNRNNIDIMYDVAVFFSVIDPNADDEDDNEF
jgi:hypothetical protein